MPLAEARLFQVSAYDSTLQVCRWVWEVHCQPSWPFALDCVSRKNMVLPVTICALVVGM